MSKLNNIGTEEPWLQLHVLAAERGDCAVLSYGASGREFRLVIDAGLGKTADRLKEVLSRSDNSTWELLVITHIDLDHIDGALSFLENQAFASRFQDIWFNGRQHLDPPGSESLGVKQGLRLEKLLSQKDVRWNEAFGKGIGAVCLPESGEPIKKTLEQSGAVLTVLSPTISGLASLRVIWDRYVNAKSKTIPNSSKPSVLPGVERLGGGRPNIPKLANTTTPMDSSVANGSSIAFIFEFEGKRILFGADAHEDVLIGSAKQLPPGEREVSIFKLPHHGSSANVTRRLLEAYPSNRYVFSTNGALHDHPDDVAVARVLHHSPHAQLVFNYSGRASKLWSKEANQLESTFSTITGLGEDGIILNL